MVVATAAVVAMVVVATVVAAEVLADLEVGKVVVVKAAAQTVVVG